MAFGSFEKGQVQNPCIPAYANLGTIGTQDRHGPDAGIFIHVDISNDADRNIHKSLGVYDGHLIPI
jgi:hypothetical protein